MIDAVGSGGGIVHVAAKDERDLRLDTWSDQRRGGRITAGEAAVGPEPAAVGLVDAEHLLRSLRGEADLAPDRDATGDAAGGGCNVLNDVGIVCNAGEVRDRDAAGACVGDARGDLGGTHATAPGKAGARSSLPGRSRPNVSPSHRAVAIAFPRS